MRKLRQYEVKNLDQNLKQFISSDKFITALHYNGGSHIVLVHVKEEYCNIEVLETPKDISEDGLKKAISDYATGAKMTVTPL